MGTENVKLVEICFSGKNTVQTSQFARLYYFVQFSYEQINRTTIERQTQSILENENSIFTATAYMNLALNSDQNLRLKVFSSSTGNLNSFLEVGRAEIQIRQLMGRMNKRTKLRLMLNGKITGKLILSCQMLKAINLQSTIKIKSDGIPNSNSFFTCLDKPRKIYLTLSAFRDYNCELVHTTEAALNDPDTSWKQFCISTHRLISQYETKFKIEVWDWHKQLVGSVLVDLNRLIEVACPIRFMLNSEGEINYGQLILESVKLKRSTQSKHQSRNQHSQYYVLNDPEQIPHTLEVFTPIYSRSFDPENYVKKIKQQQKNYYRQLCHKIKELKILNHQKFPLTFNIETNTASKEFLQINEGLLQLINAKNKYINNITDLEDLKKKDKITQNQNFSEDYEHQQSAYKCYEKVKRYIEQGFNSENYDSCKIFQAIKSNYRQYLQKSTWFVTALLANEEIKFYARNKGKIIENLGFVLATETRPPWRNQSDWNTIVKIGISTGNIEKDWNHGYFPLKTSHGLSIIFNIFNTFTIQQMHMNEQSYYEMSLEFGAIPKLYYRDKHHGKLNTAERLLLYNYGRIEQSKQESSDTSDRISERRRRLRREMEIQSRTEKLKPKLQRKTRSQAEPNKENTTHHSSQYNQNGYELKGQTKKMQALFEGFNTKMNSMLIDYEANLKYIKPRAELQQKLEEYRTSNPVICEYATKFYWTLSNYLLCYRMISSGLVKGEALEQTAFQWLFENILKSIPKTASSVPVIGQAIGAIQGLVNLVIQRYYDGKFELEVRKIVDFVELHNNQEHLDLQISKVGLFVAQLRAKNIYSIQKRGWLKEKFHQISNWISEAIATNEAIKINEDSPIAQQVVIDVTLMMVVIFETTLHGNSLQKVAEIAFDPRMKQQLRVLQQQAHSRLKR